MEYENQDIFKHRDERGDYYWGNLTAPLKTDNEVSIWKGINPSLNNRMWSIPKKLISQLSKEKKNKH